MRFPNCLFIFALLATWIVADRTANAAPSVDFTVLSGIAMMDDTAASEEAPDEAPVLVDNDDEVEAVAVSSEFSKTAASQTSTALPLGCRRFKAVRFSASDQFGHSLQLQHVRLQV